MKKLLIITILSLICITLPSTGFSKLYVLRAESINPYEKLWMGICQIESNNDSLAFRIDTNGKPSVGIAQIQESRLSDYNRLSGSNFILNDMYSPSKARKVFMYFCNSMDYKQICQKWNGSGPMVEVYWEKLTKILYNQL
jgi:hypothetical protein